ncbi:hypothetical protein YSY43_47700 [Paenibacillus sp. YSY-4.3]
MKTVVPAGRQRESGLASEAEWNRASSVSAAKAAGALFFADILQTTIEIITGGLESSHTAQG